jgi:GT2 family glycosyltransferase
VSDPLIRRDGASIVVETITAREHPGHGAVVDEIGPTIAALVREGAAVERLEILVVLDPACRADADAIRQRYPMVRVVLASTPNYFAAKNAGVEAATGAVVALVDADCVPQPGWLAALLAPFADPRVDVVAGQTRYDGPTLAARTFSVPDFATVIATPSGASGFNVNNVAYRRDRFLAEPLDARIRRNGGCYFQYHALRARGARIVYAPDAVIRHGLDVHGLGFVRKHFERGFDGTAVYRLDTRRVLRGSAWVQRLGPAALPGLAARRLLADWIRLVRDRRQMGVGTLALPYYAGVVAMTRSIELAGGVAAWVRPGWLSSPPGELAAAPARGPR